MRWAELITFRKLKIEKRKLKVLHFFEHFFFEEKIVCFTIRLIILYAERDFSSFLLFSLLNYKRKFIILLKCFQTRDGK